MMAENPFPQAILVAVDFSPCSLRALDSALAWSRGESDVTVLHVVDTHLVRRIEHVGLGEATECIAKLRGDAERRLAALKKDRPTLAFQTMLVEGVPFIEIVKIANDLDCDLIVMGSHATDGGLTEILFGSTAEKVLRGARRPVLCLP